MLGGTSTDRITKAHLNENQEQYHNQDKTVSKSRQEQRQKKTTAHAYERLVGHAAISRSKKRPEVFSKIQFGPTDYRNMKNAPGLFTSTFMLSCRSFGRGGVHMEGASSEDTARCGTPVRREDLAVRRKDLSVRRRVLSGLFGEISNGGSFARMPQPGAHICNA